VVNCEDVTCCMCLTPFQEAYSVGVYDRRRQVSCLKFMLSSLLIISFSIFMQMWPKIFVG
jgi:hypothetical protein